MTADGHLRGVALWLCLRGAGVLLGALLLAWYSLRQAGAPEASLRMATLLGALALAGLHLALGARLWRALPGARRAAIVLALLLLAADGVLLTGTSWATLLVLTVAAPVMLLDLVLIPAALWVLLRREASSGPDLWGSPMAWAALGMFSLQVLWLLYLFLGTLV